MPSRRGIALLTTLAVGAVLTILAVSLLTLYFNDYHSQKIQQQAIQAYWNARSGVETYCDSRHLPTDGRYDFGAVGLCQVTQSGTNLVFTGQSGSVHRTITLLSGDPAQRVEQP
jgi:type II secretory pathway pseudopilin PulG